MDDSLNSPNFPTIQYTVNGESFAGLNFHSFDPMKYFAEILLQFVGQECSQL